MPCAHRRLSFRPRRQSGVFLSPETEGRFVQQPLQVTDALFASPAGLDTEKVSRRRARSARCYFLSTIKAPLGTFFRYICDNGTYTAQHDDLVGRRTEAHRPVEGGFIDKRDRVREGREPNTSIAQCLASMRTLDRLDKTSRARHRLHGLVNKIAIGNLNARL